MNDFQRCAGIHLTASKLQYVEIEKKSETLSVDSIGQTFISPPIIFNEQNERLIDEQLQTAFDELKIRNPLKSNTVSFTLPPELFITIQLPYEAKLNQAEIREEFNWEISQLFPFVSVEELALKFYELDGSLLPGKNNALIVALNKKYLLLIKNFCVRNNLSPKLVDNASIAANSFLNQFYINKNSISINLYNSRNSITLFINISSKPGYVKVFPKHDGNYLNKLIGEMSRDNFKVVTNQSFNSAILCGEDLESEFLSEIGRGTGLVFEHFNPFEIVKFKTELQDIEISQDQFSSFISATGVASRFS